MARKVTTEDWIERAKEVHGDKYIYDQTVYSGSKKILYYTCPDHGTIEQRADSHLEGRGCRECGKKLQGNKHTLERFIANARRIHGDLYVYDNSTYEGSHFYTTVTCRSHGDFTVTPSCHLQGSGCPKCFIYTGRTTLYLVMIESHGEAMLKVGITDNTVEARFSSRKGFFHQKVTNIAELHFEERSDARTIEAYLHTKHRKHKFTPKVKFAGHTECFNIEALETIKQDFGV